ncbi:MBL fold metallo-hydrolase [Candidatus Woesearchaeota archaeon]|nr:MBL fold metallo-hydrolase [Candidatus Woesearchaeota archaeon]
MINKITFLGTAGDSYVAGKQMRGSGGLILRLGEIQLHIDPGPGALTRANEYGINLRANTAVLVSNNSILHSNDTNAVIDAMTYGGIDKKGVLVANRSVVEGTEEEKPVITNLHKSYVERIVVMDEGQRLGIENVEIHALPTITNDPNAIGFKILAPDFTLVYTSDTKYSKDVVKEYQGADILILNVPEPGNEKVEYQLNSESVIKVVKAVNPKLAIISHFGIKMIKSDPLYEGREIQKATGVQVLIAKDGLSVTPGSYSAKSDQKRLSTYKDQETGEVKTGEQEDVPEQEEVIAEEKPVEEETKVEEAPKEEGPVEEPEEQHKVDHQEHLNF